MARPPKGGTARKVVVSVRATPDLAASFDAWCAKHDLSRSAALLRFMESPFMPLGGKGPSATQRPDPVMPVGRKPWNPPPARREVEPRFKKGMK